jgi:hypothetical protein
MIVRSSSAPVLSGAALLAAILLAGCAAAPAPAAAPPTQQFPPPPDPIPACARQVEYWAGEKLRGAVDPGYDYQHMGLTSGQAEAVTRIVEKARAEGAGVVPGLAREACEKLAADPRAPWGG